MNESNDELLEIARKVHGLYFADQVISVDPRFGGPAVFISESQLANWAPLSYWTLNEPREDAVYPYGHSIQIDGVLIYAISSEPVLDK